MAEEQKPAKPTKKPDLTLSDGREIYMNLNAVSIKEWRTMKDLEQPEVEGDKILARVCGMTLEEVQSLGAGDWRSAAIRMHERFRNPMADPT